MKFCLFAQNISRVKINKKNFTTLNKRIRWYRKLHRLTGFYLFSLLLIVAITGILLGWKKNSFGIISANNYVGTTITTEKWLPIFELNEISNQQLKLNTHQEISTKLDRIDIRPEKGQIKFIYENHYYAVQLDGANGKLLLIEYRLADLLENIHDGSILDRIFQTNTNFFKLVFTSITGLSIVLFSFTGFWLYYGPKKLKKTN